MKKTKVLPGLSGINEPVSANEIPGSQFPADAFLLSSVPGSDKAGNLTVLMTTDTLSDIWVYALTLAKALGKYNIAILLATMGNRLSSYQKSQLKTIPNVRYFESDYGLEWMEKPWRDVDRAGKWLLSLSEKYHPDIVHLNNFAHGSLDWPCKSLIAGHSCIFSWYQDVYDIAPPACFETYFSRVSAGLKHSDLVTAPTSSFLKRLKEIYGSFKTLGHVYNGCECHGCPDVDKVSVVFAAGGLWDDAKNIRVLARASRYIDAPIYAAGSKRDLNGNVADSENLRFLGFLNRSQMSDWYCRSAVYVLPAKYEPFGFSVLEAAMSGCALVLGDISSLREIWGDAAVYVDPDDDKQIAHTINNLIADSKLRDSYGKKAQGKAGTYSPERMAGEYLRLYNSLLASQPVPCREHAAV